MVSGGRKERNLPSLATHAHASLGKNDKSFGSLHPFSLAQAVENVHLLPSCLLHACHCFPLAGLTLLGEFVLCTFAYPRSGSTCVPGHVQVCVGCQGHAVCWWWTPSVSQRQFVNCGVRKASDQAKGDCSS